VAPEKVVVSEPCGEQACVGETITVLLTDLYFESGSATLTPDGVARLAEVASTIRSRYPDRRIRVEGHTDSNPIGPSLKDTYPSNWELSSARAAAVVRHFQWTHGMIPEQFEVVGFGNYQPVGTNATADGRKRNRRVRIAVLP
jgi:chemotaxis protein MotB